MKISSMTAANTAQDADEIVIARSGGNFKMALSTIKSFIQNIAGIDSTGTAQSTDEVVIDRLGSPLKVTLEKIKTFIYDISGVTAANAAQTSDEVVVTRSGSVYKLTLDKIKTLFYNISGLSSANAAQDSDEVVITRDGSPLRLTIGKIKSLVLSAITVSEVSTSISGITGAKSLRTAMLQFGNFQFPVGTATDTTAYRLPSSLYPFTTLDLASSINGIRFTVTKDGYIRPNVSPTSVAVIRGTFTYLTRS